MNLVHGDIYAFVHHRKKSDMQVDMPRHIYIYRLSIFRSFREYPLELSQFRD